MKEHAQEMFFAGSNLSEKTAKELFTGDYKRFSMGDVTFGIGQVSCMDSQELAQVKKKILSYMKEQYASSGVDMLFFMLTDILNESTEMLFYGKRAKQILEEAYLLGAENFKDEGSCTLRKIVSRKKQVIPAIVGSLQQ